MKTEQNTQIMNLKSIVLNQGSSSKPQFILKQYKIVCRSSYPTVERDESNEISDKLRTVLLDKISLTANTESAD